MLRFILVMVPLVFVINGLTKGNWVEAFFFAVAVAVGLTPEMLPMIVTVCLSKGALAMSRKKVIVKRINAIQNLGAMDVLCTDKTGTLTMDHVILEKHCDVVLKEDDGVLALAYMNSHFQTGLKNVLDRAMLAHTETHAHADDPRIRQGGRNPLRLPAPHHVGRGPDARRQGPHHQQGSPGGDLPALQELRARRRAVTRWTTPHRRAQGGVRTALGRRLPRAGDRQQGHRAARRRRGRRHALLQGRRVRPDPERLCRLPRPAQGDRHGGHQGPARPRRRASRSSPATTIWSPARSARRSGCPPSSCCSAARSRR